MSERSKIAMTPAEVAEFLDGRSKAHLATLQPDGGVHLVTMFYAMLDGQVAFWTYRASQKARNLARDPRITCLVEDGQDYFQLRGVQIRGVVRPFEAYDDVLRIGRLIGRALGEVPSVYLEHTALKRNAYVIEPSRVVSWDHRKL